MLPSLYEPGPGDSCAIGFSGMKLNRNLCAIKDCTNICYVILRSQLSLQENKASSDDLKDHRDVSFIGCADAGLLGRVYDLHRPERQL